MYKTTKSAASDVFDEFYAKLSSGELVADSYNLTFTNVETGTAYSFSGNWKNAEVELQDATYRVTGKSTATGEKTQENCNNTNRIFIAENCYFREFISKF